jgi:ribonuclease/clavin/mitogillin
MNNSPPLESVSVIFIHEQQIFAVQRQPYLLAFPGYHAFPGGKIDADESSVAFETEFLREHDALRMRALQREIMEELGYDLEEGIKKGEVLSVSELAEALAPPFSPVRFRTWFYRVDLSKLITFKVDSGEFTDSFWKTSAELLETFRAGKSLMVHPTRWVLEGLQKNPQATAFGDLSQNFTDNETVPCLEMLEGVPQYAVRSATLPPASMTNAFLLGDSEAPKLLVDPSPNSGEEYQRLLNTIKVKKLDAIFLTHHHPDHHQFSNQLARQLKLPIILSRLNYGTWLKKKKLHAGTVPQ